MTTCNGNAPNPKALKLKSNAVNQSLSMSSSRSNQMQFEGHNQALRTGDLIYLRGSGGGLTLGEDGKLVMQFSGDIVEQKFVVESAGEDVKGYGLYGGSALGEPIVSGGLIRLRVLKDGGMVSWKAPGNVQPSALPPDVEDGQANESWELSSKESKHLTAGFDPSAVFTFMLWREEEYRSARRFALSVKPLNKGCLEVYSFLPPGGPSEFDGSGWRIATINGRPATPAMVESILEQARIDMEDDKLSLDTGAPGARAHTMRMDSMVSAGSGTGPATSRPQCQYRVCFEKAYGNDSVVGIGDHVVLRVAALPTSGAASGATVGFGMEIGRSGSNLETGPGAGVKAIKVSADSDPLVLTPELADIGSQDDPPLYSWAAEEIRRRAEANLVRASLAEKCRMAIVTGFNARAGRMKTGGMMICSRELHLRMLRQFSMLALGYQEIEVQFDSAEEISEELRFCSTNGDDSQPLIVQVVETDDGQAAAAGIQAGDEVVEIEVDRNGNRDSLHRSPKEMREVLGLLSTPKMSSAKSTATVTSTVSAVIGDRSRKKHSSPPVSLLLRSASRFSIDSAVQNVFVSQAALVAQLLPSWEEIARPEDSRGEAPSSRAAAAARLLRHDEFFRLKCSLVTSLLQRGWELKYTAFAESAMLIHRHLDALHRDGLKSRFPGSDDAAKLLREGLLAEQLDALTASWESMPRAVKELQPQALRKLFRHDVELVAMHDSVDAAYKTWREKARDESVIVEMPGALQRFVERVRPPYATSSETLSTAWLLRAWFGPTLVKEYESVQRIVNNFTEIYEATEQYWLKKLGGAATHMEKTQEQLERALEMADMRVALIPSAGAAEELQNLQSVLSPDLTLEADLSLGDQLIPKGLKLVLRGQVLNYFQADIKNSELHRRLPELADNLATSDLRLLFGGDDYSRARAEAAGAIGELGAIIRVVKTASAAFPDTVLKQCQELLGKHHKGELRAVTQDNKRRIQIQEKEAEEMVRTANIKLSLAEAQRRAAEGQLKEAEEERVLAEVAKNDAQKRADQWWDNLQAMAREKEMLQSEKGNLESEKLEWTKVQSLMEIEKTELQADIEKAKDERRKLEQAADKWHKTLQTVKAQAEEKEAHLKEIQAIIKKQQEESLAPASDFTLTQLMTVLSKAFQPTEPAASSSTGEGHLSSARSTLTTATTERSLAAAPTTAI
eukprot:TRINITY_DN2548_c0_g1_i3.p1 TRINITY_DN2548_c0_g1~~TRINITY_DN2548_c0_g1_i3.p1  ORF type:complete len:1292 (-),score=313.47 TRINITY_DN2548_c0_g1_i3:163-3726(-)